MHYFQVLFTAPLMMNSRQFSAGFSINQVHPDGHKRKRLALPILLTHFQNIGLYYDLHIQIIADYAQLIKGETVSVGINPDLPVNGADVPFLDDFKILEPGKLSGENPVKKHIPVTIARCICKKQDSHATYTLIRQRNMLLETR
jgi:hypothetical protein